MYQRDYILRIIEQLGQALVQLRKRILGGPFEADPREELASIAARAGIDLGLVRRVDENTLRLIVFPSGEPDPARCWLIAELLYLDGLHHREIGEADTARLSLDRALELFSWIQPEWQPPHDLPTPADRSSEIREIRGR